jgi:hypothetical protein
MPSLVSRRAGSLVLCAAALGACGGSTAGASPVDAAFATKALAVCTQAGKEQAAWAAFPAGSFDPVHPDAAKLAQVGTWLEVSVLPTFDHWQTGLAALGTPAAGAAAWSPVVAGVAQTADLARDQIAAAKAGDPTAFAAATVRLQAAHTRFLTDAKAAGVEACGDIVRG